MNIPNVSEVCRLCPSSGVGLHNMINVFNEKLIENVKEIVFVTTGVEILENDLVSQKICEKCFNITLKMFQFRQNALEHDRTLKEMLSRCLSNKGVKLANTCITISKEKPEISQLSNIHEEKPAHPSTSKDQIKPHPTVANIFKIYPNIKLPKKCFENDLAPVVSFSMDEVENYFTSRNLDMKQYIYKSNSDEPLPHKVAKKKLSCKTKQKTVSPLRISKKLFGNVSNKEFVCNPVVNQRKGRKRKISLTDNRDSNIKHINNNSARVVQLASQSDTNSSEPRSSEPPMKKPNINNSPLAPEDLAVVSRSPEHTPSEVNSSKSSSLNISVITSATSTSKPAFIESLGLTPTVYPSKSQMLIVCKVCDSVHHNAAELKWHTRKHMVCQFCKRKFKTFKAKENHIDNLCKIKNVMNSPGPIVSLERIHLNVGVRNKYVAAFSAFDPIPNLGELAPSKHMLKSASQSDDKVTVLSDDEETLASTSDPISNIPTLSLVNMSSTAVEKLTFDAVSLLLNNDEVTVLSDDEESPASSRDPLSDVPVKSLAEMPYQAVRKEKFKCIAKVKPDINVKNNNIMNCLASNISDKYLIKDLISLTKSTELTTSEQILQTDLPSNEDIEINSVKETCRFKNIKEQLMTYVIPLTVRNGPFNVSLKLEEYSKRSKKNRSSPCWGDLPVIDKYNRGTLKPTNKDINTNVSSQNENIDEYHPVPTKAPPLNNHLSTPPVNGTSKLTNKSHNESVSHQNVNKGACQSVLSKKFTLDTHLSTPPVTASKPTNVSYQNKNIDEYHSVPSKAPPLNNHLATPPVNVTSKLTNKSNNKTLSHQNVNKGACQSVPSKNFKLDTHLSTPPVTASSKPTNKSKNESVCEQNINKGTYHLKIPTVPSKNFTPNTHLSTAPAAIRNRNVSHQNVGKDAYQSVVSKNYTLNTNLSTPPVTVTSKPKNKSASHQNVNKNADYPVPPKEPTLKTHLGTPPVTAISAVAGFSTPIPATKTPTSRCAPTTSSLLGRSNAGVVPAQSTAMNLVVSENLTQTTNNINSSITQNSTGSPASLQNIALKKNPLVINKFMSIPRSAVNAALNKTATDHTYSNVNNCNTNFLAPVEARLCQMMHEPNNLLSSSGFRPEQSSTTHPQPTLVNSNFSFTTNTNTVAPPPIRVSVYPLGRASNSSPPTSNHPKIRIKNVWELQ